jgi:hypothetical protein
MLARVYVHMSPLCVYECMYVAAFAPAEAIQPVDKPGAWLGRLVTQPRTTSRLERQQ